MLPSPAAPLASAGGSYRPQEQFPPMLKEPPQALLLLMA
jgi:hypothetical protein